MTIEESNVVQVLDEMLFGMALGDIHRSLGRNYPSEKVSENLDLQDGQCLVGSIILSCALMEAIGHHCLGVKKHGPGDAFMEFTNVYLKKTNDLYDAQDLWQILRNGLMHNYSTSHNRATNPRKFILLKNAANWHLKQDPADTERTYLNIQSFIQNVDTATNLFLDDLAIEGSVAWTNSISWIGSNDAMTIFPVFEQTVGSGLFLTLSASSSVPWSNMSGTAFGASLTASAVTNNATFSITPNRNSSRQPKS